MKVFNKIIFIVTYPIRLILLGLIYFYKFCISPLLPNTCRFTPTCSSYMLRSIKEYGICKGFIKGCYRIIRCNPWNKKTGFDPVIDNIKGDIRWVL